MIFKVHGIEFERTGECSQCGGCYEYCVNRCPHGVDSGHGTAICTIYENRGKVCADCSSDKRREISHQMCVDFPDHPWITVVRTGQCSYSFKRVDNGSMDDLPFVDGKYKV